MNKIMIAVISIVLAVLLGWWFQFTGLEYDKWVTSLMTILAFLIYYTITKLTALTRSKE